MGLENLDDFKLDAELDDELLASAGLDDARLDARLDALLRGEIEDPGSTGIGPVRARELVDAMKARTRVPVRFLRGEDDSEGESEVVEHLAKFADQEAEVIRLRFCELHSIEEVAEITGLTKKEVRVIEERLTSFQCHESNRRARLGDYL